VSEANPNKKQAFWIASSCRPINDEIFSIFMWTVVAGGQGAMSGVAWLTPPNAGLGRLE
jgi:hypothetical protein